MLSIHTYLISRVPTTDAFLKRRLGPREVKYLSDGPSAITHLHLCCVSSRRRGDGSWRREGHKEGAAS